MTSNGSSDSADDNNSNIRETGPKIENLFSFSRYPSGWKSVILCVYFPFGVLLAILRFFIALHVLVLSFILRHSASGRSVLRGMCVILGVIVVEKGEHQSSRVIVANHVSPFDFIAIALTRRVVQPSNWDVPEIIHRLFGLINLGSRTGRDTLIKNAKNYCGSEMGSIQPLVTFPEGTMTNGNVGFLKFNNWPFSLEVPVQPLVINLWRPPVADVAPTTVGSGTLADTFWLLCVPFTVFQLQWLPEMKNEASETPESFARRVEKTVADTAQMEITNVTSHDAFEFAKRYMSEQSSRVAGSKSNRVAHPYDQLAMKVKEIVPQVPLNAILSDLERNGGSVDATIANILEGRVVYTPEKPSVSVQSNQKPLPKVSTNDPASWRELFDIRKRELLETHRRKYLQRKGYNL